MIEIKDEHISTLLLKKIIGSISPNEEMELDAWRKESEENETLYQKMLDHEYIERQLRQRSLINTERPLAEMLQRITPTDFTNGAQNDLSSDYSKAQTTDIQNRPRSWRKWIAAAAIAALTVIGGNLLWQQYTQTEQQEVAALIAPSAGTSFLPGEKKAVLTLADGRQIALGDKAGKAEPSLLDKAIAKMSGSEKQLCLDIPKGGEFKVVLDDSTEVWLNSESKLIYPEKFSDKERRVIVKGEAYFKVAHEANRPFRVETDGQVVTVHGTEFNVKSYKEDKNVLTTLVEGSISLSKANGNGEVMLRPGHQSQFSKQDASTTVRTVNAEMVTSWRYGKFVFENQTLEEIMQELSRWYNFEYEFSNNDLKQIEFMGSIPRYSQFDTALTILEKSGGIHFKRQGNKLRIMR